MNYSLVRQLMMSLLALCFLNNPRACAQKVFWGVQYEFQYNTSAPQYRSYIFAANETQVLDPSPILTPALGLVVDYPFFQINTTSRLSLQVKPALAYPLPLQALFPDFEYGYFQAFLPVMLQWNNGVYGNVDDTYETGWMLGLGMHIQHQRQVGSSGVPPSWKLEAIGKRTAVAPALQAGYRWWTKGNNRLATSYVYISPMPEQFQIRSYNRMCIGLGLVFFDNY